MCAAISFQAVLHHHAILGTYNTAQIITLGPYNTRQIIAFLDALHAVVQDRPEQPRFVVNRDKVSTVQLWSKVGTTSITISQLFPAPFQTRGGK